MILAPARLWRHTFHAVFSCSFLPKEFICFVFTTWLCEKHSHIVWMVPCQVNHCFIIQYITRQNHIYPTPTKNLDLLGVQMLQKLHLAVFVGMRMQYSYPGVNLHLLRLVYSSYRETTDIYASLKSSEVSSIAGFCTDLRKTFLENPQNRPNLPIFLAIMFNIKWITQLLN